MIIREFRYTDTDKLVEIWYEASVIAHSFINRALWEAHKEELRTKYLPGAETWVAEEGGDLLGFLSLMGNYIGGLFVAPGKQGAGIGTKLIEQAKKEKGSLKVGVYKKNIAAQKFYVKKGFKYLNEEIQRETGEIVINMMFA